VQVDAGGSTSGLDKLTGDGVKKKQEGRVKGNDSGSVRSLWRSVCIEAEEGKTCWMRAKGNGEKIEVGLWGEMERETGGKTAMAERARSF